MAYTSTELLIPEVQDAVAAAEELARIEADPSPDHTNVLDPALEKARVTDLVASEVFRRSSGYSRAQWKDIQRTLNRFTDKYLKGVRALRVDGVPGHSTRSRIMAVKWYIGYGKDRDAEVKSLFIRRIRHQHGEEALKFSSRDMLKAGASRRRRQRIRYHEQQVQSYLRPGVTRFDGVPVCKCAVPILEWCRRNGWHGHLVSGYRTPEYSDSLCRRMCGRSSCPGLCAGRASNHSGATCGRFAVDVSDYWNFRSVVARCPLRPHIFNALPRDPVHFSPSGN